ncbi:MAG: hypothetical protein D6800_14025, partial [Candidatus Zixiibacteriota bacterium]
MRRLGSNDTLTVDDTLKEKLVTDWRTADLCEFDRLMLDYVERVARAAYEIDAAYIDNLKAHGFTDRMLHDIVQVTAYFSYVNRLADGLGVELED